jgi:glycine betaine/choline ABC-type transport system substrate-binding protein
VSKRAAQKIDTERFNLKMLNKEGVREHYHITIRNKFAALENLEDSGDFNRRGTILETTSKFWSKRV